VSDDLADIRAQRETNDLLRQILAELKKLTTPTWPACFPGTWPGQYDKVTCGPQPPAGANGDG
jgi:hypothetical protein